MDTKPDAPGARRSDDHGLGQEVVDPETVLADVAVDDGSAERLRAKQEPGHLLYWIVATAVLVLVGEQSIMSFLLYIPVMGNMAVEFQTPNIVWMLTIFTLATAVVTPIVTKAADVYGKQKLLVIASSISAVGCLICFLAPNFTVLLVGRALMAAVIGAAPISVSLMREVFPARMRALAIAVAVNGTGLMVLGGPLLAGWVVGQFGTRSVFALNLGVSVAAALLALLFVPETPFRAKMRIDYLGALLLGLALLGLIGGISQISALGIAHPLVLVGVIGGVLAGLIWWQQQARTREPLISLKLLRAKPIWTTILATAAFNGTAATVNFLVALDWGTSPSDAPYGRGLTAIEIGYWSLGAGALMVVSGFLVGMTARSVGYRNHMIIGGVLWLVPVVVLGLTLTGSSTLIIGTYSVLGLANCYLAASAALVLLAAPADQRGVVSGMNYAAQGLGSAITQQVAFFVLSSSVIGTAATGVPVYGEDGFRNAFIAGGIFAAIGLITAFLIPHGRRSRKPQTPSSDAQPTQQPAATPADA